MNQSAATGGSSTSPRHLSDVTPEWLTQCVQAKGHDVVVAAFEAQQIGDGVGMMATLNRLRLTYTPDSRGTGPASLVVKFPGTSETNLAIAATFGLFKRELEFYRVAADRTTMALPAVYAAELDPDSQFVLLMEDLADMRTGDQVAGMSASEAAAGIDELVKLHAPFWDCAVGPEFDFAPIVDAVGQGDMMHNTCVAVWDAMNANFGDVVPQRMNDVRDRFLAAIPAIHAWLGRGPMTLIHSDYRLDNLMLSAPGSSRPPVVTLDWQGAMRSMGMDDVAFMLSQSVKLEERAGCERELVERYRQGLIAAGIHHYDTPESAWLDYRKTVLYLWMYAVIMSGAVDPANDRGRDLMRALLIRSAAAIHDLDCLSLLSEFE